MKILSRKPSFLSSSLLVMALLTLFSWINISVMSQSGMEEILSTESLTATRDSISKFAGYDKGTQSAFLSIDSWTHSLRLSLQTLVMSILTIILTGIAVAVTFMPAARNMIDRTKSGGCIQYIWVTIHYFIRFMFIITRSIPELLWAMFVIFIFTPSILTGAIALAIHNYGILGKLSAEVVENIDQRPIESLKTSGAGQFQLFIYGVIPQALPTVLTYLLYRWEVIIRTTVVIGFIAAGGLGRQFRLSLSWFHYDEVGVLLVSYIILVLLVDLLSAQLRKIAQ